MIISSRMANELFKCFDDLTAGGGVTSPDDMVGLDDLAEVLRQLTSERANVDYHARVCSELTELYSAKNMDYGNSFGEGFDRYGIIMALIRLEDKLNRLKSVTRNGAAMVAEESVRDTLMDLANYAIMTIVEMERGQWD